MLSPKYNLWHGVALSILIGIAGIYTGPDFSLKLFHLLVIGAMTWYVGKRAGIIVLIVSLSVWIGNLLVWGELFEWHNLWRTIERVVIFTSAVFVLDVIRRYVVERIQHAEERYTKIVESAIEGIIAVDGNAVIKFMNARASALLGYPEQQAVGMNLLGFSRDQASRTLVECMTLDTEHPYCPCEVQMTRADGTVLWLLVSATPSKTIENGEKEVVLLLTDISERKRAEVELERRYEQISAMQKLSFGLAQSLNLSKRLQNALKVVVEVTKFDAGLIYLVEPAQKKLVVQYTYGVSSAFLEKVRYWEIGKGNTGKAAESGNAFFIEDAERDAIFNKELRAIENIRGFAAIPLASKERVLGVLCIINRKVFPFSSEMKLMLQAFGKQIGFALENAKLYESAKARERELRELSLTMVGLQEEERKRFAREIHDGLSQVLTVLKINAELSINNFSGDSEKAMGYLKEVLQLSNEAEVEAKRLANDLRPAILDDFGLKAAIKLHATNFERRTGISVDLHLPFYEIRFEPIIETSVYRIVQELLANVAKHAGATKVTIQFLVREGLLALIVADNGRGFDYTAANSDDKTVHFGLRNMRERVEFIGGTFRVESVKNHGTEILMEIPIREQEQDAKDALQILDERQSIV